MIMVGGNTPKEVLEMLLENIEMNIGIFQKLMAEMPDDSRFKQSALNKSFKERDYIIALLDKLK